MIVFESVQPLVWLVLRCWWRMSIRSDSIFQWNSQISIFYSLLQRRPIWNVKFLKKLDSKKIRSSKHQIGFDTARTGSCSWNGCSKNSDFRKNSKQIHFKLSFVIWLCDISSSETFVFKGCLVLWYEIHNDFIISYHIMIDW